MKLRDAVQNLRYFRLPPGFRGRSGWFVQLWWIVQSTLFGLSPQFMYRWRRWLLRLFGARLGRGVLIRPTARVTYPWKVSIGDWSWIGDDVVLYSLGEIEIGSNAVISQRAYICTASHDYTKPGFDIYSKKIVIGNDADSLAKAIEKIRSMNMQRMGRIGWQWMRKKFIWDVIAKQMFELYQEITGKVRA